MAECFILNLRREVDNNNLDFIDAMKFKFVAANTTSLSLITQYEIRIGGTGCKVVILSDNAHIVEGTTNKGKEYVLGTPGTNVYILADSLGQTVDFIIIGLDKFLRVGSVLDISGNNSSIRYQSDITKELLDMPICINLVNVFSEDLIVNLDNFAEYPVNQTLRSLTKITSRTVGANQWVGNFKNLGKFINLKQINLFGANTVGGSVEQYVAELKANGAVSDSEYPYQLQLGYSGVKLYDDSAEGLTYDGYKNLTWDNDGFYLV